MNPSEEPDPEVITVTPDGNNLYESYIRVDEQNVFQGGKLEILLITLIAYLLSVVANSPKKFQRIIFLICFRDSKRRNRYRSHLELSEW